MGGSVPAPSRVEINVASNLIGTALTALIGLAFVPIYVRLLGIESYGVVGFFAAMQATLRVLDLGITPTISRELARVSALPDMARDARNMVRTLEIPYWILGTAVGGVIVLTASFLAGHWLQAATLPADTLVAAIMLMGVVILLQWPTSLYQGGLHGLQRQPLLNAINVVMALTRSFGAVAVLTFLSPTIVVFFQWQAIIAAVQVLVLGVALWRSLPSATIRPLFDARVLRRVWKFAAGMSLITLTGVILTQVDKLILSRQFDLTRFGYYVLASVVGTSLAYATSPVFNAIFPRFSALVAGAEDQDLRALYHRATQFLAVILLPAASTVAFLAVDIMRVWTGSGETAANTHQIVALLAVGSAINGLMHVPYALQLAHGWTSLGVRLNLLLVALAVPAVVVMGRVFGGPGAAAVWVFTNVLYMGLAVPATHRRLMPGEAVRWFAVDIGLPLCASVAVVLVLAHTLAPAASRWLEAGRIMLILLLSAGAAVVAAPMMRAWSIMRLRYIASVVGHVFFGRASGG